MARATAAALLLLVTPSCESLKGNVPYHSKSSASTDSTTPVASDDAITVRLKTIQLNDRFGNDFERTVLLAAGILKDTKGGPGEGVPIAAVGDSLSEDLDKEIESFFTPELVSEMQAAAPPSPDGVPISATSDFVKSVKKLVKDKLKQELRASYTLSVTTTAISFDTLARLDDVATFEFDQASVERVFTPAKPDLLLFEGGKANRLNIAMKLSRDSLIARSLQKGLDKLGESHWVANMLESALSAVSAGFAAELGKQIGERIDTAIYEEAQKRFAPTSPLFDCTWRFDLTSQPSSSKLHLGLTSCVVTATVEGEAIRDLEDSKLFVADIEVNREVKP